MKIALPIVLLSMLIVVIIPMQSVRGQETLIWTADVSSDGTPVTSPTLEDGREYRIVATEIFWYDYAANLAADANYYTTDPTNAWNWGNHFEPLEGSFLRINGDDVNWGSYVEPNWPLGHNYSIIYTGTGAPIIFTIVDLIDGDYTNNYCHLPVEIWEQPPTEIGKSPGYWGHQYRAHMDGKGSPHHTLAELVGWTEDIDEYYGVTPPDFYGYDLPPVSSMDTNGDGVFTTVDAYAILVGDKQHWKDVWIGCANWYNWAAGFPLYPD